MDRNLFVNKNKLKLKKKKTHNHQYVRTIMVLPKMPKN